MRMNARSERTPEWRGGAEFQHAVRACWAVAGKAGLFSFAINLLVLAPSIYMLQVYDRVLTSGRVETLAMMTGLLAGALLLMGALEALRSILLSRASTWLSSRLGPLYLGLSVRSRLVGDASGAQPLRDLAQVQSFLSSPALTVFFDAPWTPFFILLIWFLHPWLGAFAIASAVALLAFSLVNEMVTRKANQQANSEQIVTLQQAEAAIRNAEVVRAMGMLPAMLHRWQARHGTALAAQQTAAERNGALLGFTKFLRFFVQSATLGLGAYLVLRNEVSAGAMIASSILLGRALAPVETAMGSWRNFAATRVAYARLKGRMASIPPEPRRMRLPAPEGHVSLRNVSYAPPGVRALALQDVSFTLSPGEAVAVIGASASGKTSLCRLLVGINRPTSGEIRLDGAELHHWNMDDLGAHIGYLPQDVELFAGSVRDNIARMDAPDDEAVARAAFTAHAHDMIQRLPHGYDTQIGDGGARLSGGQRQRIGLARAIYGRPRLIVLDEPNANLDQAGESALAAAIAELKEEGVTLVIVGHRPSTLAQADKILLLREGRVELFGPRAEVLARLRAAANAGAAAQGELSRTGTGEQDER
jgi:PrtD family type I secretion system ABC transporter